MMSLFNNNKRMTRAKSQLKSSPNFQSSFADKRPATSKKFFRRKVGGTNSSVELKPLSDYKPKNSFVIEQPLPKKTTYLKKSLSKLHINTAKNFTIDSYKSTNPAVRPLANAGFHQPCERLP